jgi:hypothetical protein
MNRRGVAGEKAAMARRRIIWQKRRAGGGIGIIGEIMAA